MQLLGLETHREEAVGVVKSLYNAFIDYDASMIEINPYAEDTYGKSKCQQENSLSGFIFQFQNIYIINVIL